MKSSQILRLLSLLGFLLLFAPFYDTCNGKGMKDAALEAPAVEEAPSVTETDTISNDDVLVETDTINNDTASIENDTINDEIIAEPTFYQKAYEFIDDERNQNAFEMADLSRNLLIGLHETSFDEILRSCKEGIAKRDFSGLALHIGSFCFIIIVVNTFAVLVLSGFKRFRLFYRLSFVSLICILVFLTCVPFMSFFETYKQIKWGLYTFSITQTLILVFPNN